MTNNTNVIRVTKAQKFAAIKDFLPSDLRRVFPGNDDKQDYVLDYAEAIQFLDETIDLLNRKNSSESKKQVEAQKIDEEYKEIIVKYLASLSGEESGKTCTEILNDNPNLVNRDKGTKLSNQKVASLLRQLKVEGKVIDQKGKKGINLFRLA